jgi:hypothetical protein
MSGLIFVTTIELIIGLNASGGSDFMSYQLTSHIIVEAVSDLTH